MARVRREFTAVYKKAGGRYLGWIEEIPGASTQGRTLKETKGNLKEALSLILAANKELHRKNALGKGIIREQVAVSV